MTRLSNIRAGLEGDPASRMDVLLGRLGGLRTAGISKPVQVNGVDFQVVAEQKWLVPEAGKTRLIDIGLRISNRTDTDLEFFDMLELHLATAEGKEIKRAGGIAVAVASDEVRRRGINEWKRNRLVQAGADLVIPEYRRQKELMAYLMDA